MEVIDLSPKPRLRLNVEIMPLGDGRFILRDVAGYVDDTLLLNEISVLVLSMLDGTKTESEIKRIIESTFKIPIPQDQIRKLIETLDDKGFLDSHKFNAVKVKKREEFRSAQLRKSNMAGRSYPKGGREAEEFFSSILELFGTDRAEKNVLAVISPHIEIVNGMKIYGLVWSFLKNSLKKPELFFVFGTSHAYSPYPLILTDKDFETPFGVLKVNKDMVGMMKDIIGNTAFEDEILHKNEHSIDFQAVFIKYLFPSAHFVPVLCSASWLYHGLVTAGGNRTVSAGNMEGDLLATDIRTGFGIDSFGSTGSQFEDIIMKLKEKIPDGVVFIAGADFAHIGVRFGDEPVSPYDVSLVRLKDIVSLAKFAQNSAEGFLKSITIDGNSRRVCGVAPIYTILKMLEGISTKGDILGWDIWVDETASAVSFGGAYIALK